MEFYNALYYTFSTIAQVLAGFIALSGVFVIFKIQEFKKMQFLQVQYFYNYLNGVNGMFISSFHDCPSISIKLKTLHRSECIGGMEEEMKKILADPNVQKSTEYNNLTKMMKIFMNIDSARKSTLLWAKLSVISGLTTILFSVIILTLIPHIRYQISTLIYLIGFSGFILSVSSMTKVILTSLKERNYLL